MTQKEALDILKLGYNVYLTGPPGSGKTFLLNRYVSFLKGNQRGVAITASTGIAATHINGITIHSWSGLGIKEKFTEQDIRKLQRKSYLRKRFKNTNVLIIDEISMLHNFQFDILNRICQAFKNNPKAFGGMQVVCSGDFFQLPPVQKQGEPKFITESDIWRNMDIKICYLEEQHRQKDNDLSTLLNCIRRNAIEESRALLLDKKRKEKTFSISPVKLYTHNVDVDAINNFQLAKIDEKEFVYDMEIKGQKNIAAILKKSCLVPEKLVLKKGAEVMFVKNNFERGYVNGTLGKVIGFNKENLPIVKTFRGKCVAANSATWKIEEDDITLAEITQIPLRLAWAITVHKSQGMNLDAAEIDLSKCFIEGMGYVALSRLVSLAGLNLKGLNDLALLVNQGVLELDKLFKQKSRQIAEDITGMDQGEKRIKQREFLRSLPGMKWKRAQKKKETTYEETETLVAAKLPIKEIAGQRGLTENTIISHLEKIVESKGNFCLEYLRPSENRFEKIEQAFQKTDNWLLNPAREILGQNFSYQEIRIARLFLKNKSPTKKS